MHMTASRSSTTGAANEVEWIALEWFGTQGETMFPVGLIEQKKASASGRD
jgi:hypothetical protein